MAKVLQPHVAKLREYLFQPSERNEDLALSYFREIYGEQFKRQNDAANADGYVAGHFVLELKGDTNDWYAALFQGLAYRNKGLAFSLLVVAAKHFLGLWQVDNIPEEIRNEVADAEGAPNAIGKKMAKKFAAKQTQLLRKATWYRPELFGGLFSEKPELFAEAIKTFEKALKDKKKVRQPVTLKNFVQVLGEMKQFFDPNQPIKAVRAFYSMIYGPWDDASTVVLNQRYDDRATIGGVEISYLVPGRRSKFKEFVENRAVSLKAGENIDDFFARYDEALDVVDSDFRVKNGIFFTDLDLSKFAMWLVKQKIPNLGRNYLVIDPACGSGNLVTNWRSPLELRHKVVSEIEPELLYAVEQRMKGDQWHNGKFTVVPKVTENIGLNFLDKSASEYVSILKKYLAEKGHKPDKPIAFLCNPPYRSDDDQAADAVSYEVDSAIVDLIGNDAASERYCCFLAQMKLICQAAADSGMPEDSVLMLFTKAAWLTKRPVFQQVRRQILGAFEDVGGVLVNGKEFFDLKGKFPIAFTMWRYRGPEAKLDPDRSIPLLDLCDLKKEVLKNLPWNDQNALDEACKKLTNGAKIQHIGADRLTFSGEWLGFGRRNLYRNLSAEEKGDKSQSHLGLPKNDPRHGKKTIYGTKKGTSIGYLLDLTPCRTTIEEELKGRPWFHLDSRFMKVRTIRCFSGLPDSRGYCARDLAVAQRLFLWFSVSKAFAQEGFPLWADAEELWVPSIPKRLEEKVSRYTSALVFGDNECIETVFPANNPVKEAIEIRSENPFCPLNSDSFWSKNFADRFSQNDTDTPGQLVAAVNRLYSIWKSELKGRSEIIAHFEAEYFVGEGRLTAGAGIVQIRDYAKESNNERLLNSVGEISELVKTAKSEFNELLIAEDQIGYFSNSGATKSGERKVLPFVAKTKFDHILEKRLALAATLIDESKNDPNFGVTKFVKLFYLADAMSRMGLKTDYYRQAAGPLDPRALYHDKVGLLPIGRRHGYFDTAKAGPLSKFVPKENFKTAVKKAEEVLGNDIRSVRALVKKFDGLDTNQAEIIATLFACWNDLLLDDKNVTDDLIVREFLKNWHPEKTQFPKARLMKALVWMREQEIVPKGTGQKTSVKSEEFEIPA
ncbi:MAG: hypothetical protein A2428_17970 [Bdellovibrionales bacterium RIFOXYC1_FULL_54_43]|nr:MAG: hypothetical protein A2428_17970 [Bdellovibrionales bacterium RIFOXYC1_FULL_54_43]OFZ79709.1 MAG: hypothetical protein A2603_06160 [Bdellovibrionales bacterium RIFOXYD1_FULL_55_31]